MTQSEAIRAKARQLQGQPVRVTLHNGETYIGYITNCYDRGVVLAGAASPVSSNSGKRTHPVKQKRSNRHSKSVKGTTNKQHTSGSRSRGPHNSRKSSRSPKSMRSRKPEAQVSALFPMLGSLFGGFGGLSGGLKLFGMIQRVFPVIKMGYGMIKSISPFVGAMKGLMAPSTVEATDAD